MDIISKLENIVNNRIDMKIEITDDEGKVVKIEVECANFILQNILKTVEEEKDYTIDIKEIEGE